MCDLNVEKAKLTSEQIEFIQIFTRMEFALKECGYVRTGNQNAEPDWSAFAKKILKNSFYEEEKKLSSILCNEPPMCQIIRGEALDWKLAAKPDNIDDLINAVKRVRNNLLHGGKHGELDVDRNEALVSKSVELLKRAVVMDACIKSAFEGL